jgi:molecular chaperone GrpE
MPDKEAARKIKVTDKRHSAPTEEPDPVDVPESEQDEAGSEKAKAARRTPDEADRQTRAAASQEPDSADHVGSAQQGAPSQDPDSADHELDSARAEAAEYLDHLKRLKAEFDNYRKRVLKEQTRSMEMATEPLMTKLLEVLDEFELAVMAAEGKPEFERFRRGVEMVYGKLKEILRSEGLERIDAEDQPFDPEMHEALLQVDGGDGDEAYVADVLRTGYRLKGRLLRPAGVKVARR